MKVTKENIVEKWNEIEKYLNKETHDTYAQAAPEDFTDPDWADVVDPFIKDINRQLENVSEPQAAPKAEEPKKAEKPKKEPKAKKPKAKFQKGSKVVTDHDDTLQTITEVIWTGHNWHYKLSQSSGEWGEEQLTKAPKKAKKEKKPKKEGNSISASIKIIKRYGSLHGKAYNGDTKEKAISILRALQKAILAHDIRKTDPYADEIDKIQENLLILVNNRASGQPIEIADIEHLREIGTTHVVMPIVKLLQAYVRFIGKSGVKEEAKKLRDKLTAYNGSEYSSLVKDAVISLSDYIDGKLDSITASLEALEGLNGIFEPKHTTKPKPVRSHSMNASQLSGVEFDTIDLTGKWARIIGKPSSPYKLMIFGKPGSGKSTLALQYADYLANSHDQRVLYVASEEGLSYTMQEKLNRMGISSANLQITDYLPKDLSAYDVIFIDSVNHAGLSAEDLRKLDASRSYVYVFQTTKDGTFRGSQEYLHDVDTSIRVEDMTAHTEKNRFGAQGECRVD
ncbi:MAG: AAA family ATPase [Bacteroidales bacterium]|nr:AAA family ATPase [Bacteroidales bacterium]